MASFKVEIYIWASLISLTDWHVDVDENAALSLADTAQQLSGCCRSSHMVYLTDLHEYDSEKAAYSCRCLKLSVVMPIDPVIVL